MSLASAYSESTGRAQLARDRGTKDPLLSPAAKEMDFQITVDWLQHTKTVELFKNLQEDIANYEEQARSIAMAFPSMPPEESTKKLIQAQTIRQIVKLYGKPTDK